ncbi:MAG TPA: hypothetical protein VE344_01660 [Methylomirabilota bacterium]|nr:hypothetical protein [Methylomirabilota bacterium]
MNFENKMKLEQTNLSKPEVGVVGRVTPCAPSFVNTRAAGRGLPALPSAGGAHDSSPRREPWVASPFRSSSGRSERIGSRGNLFLSPLRGLRHLNTFPTVVTVDYYRSPLCGCERTPN